MSNNERTVDPARLAAFQALKDLWQNGGTIDERRFRDLQVSHRARALRLSREVLRQETGFDRVIRNYAERKPDEDTRAVLHLAMFELLLDEAAAYGVINDWVEICKSEAQMARKAGFINAVLRKVDRERPKLIPTNQFGKPLRKHLMTQYSSSTLDQINKLQSHYPATDLRLRLGLDLQEWAERLNATPIKGTRSLRLNNATKISELEGYAEGQWWVQDVAATIAADALGDVKGKKVLDLCSAPGGKALQLADAGAELTAVEISPTRAKRIYANLQRTGLEAKLIIKDALNFDETGFDAILLDAPCSATGTIRRHPDLRFDAPLERMKELNPLQARLIDHAYELLKPGGELVYCTCSLLQEEGEQAWEGFLTRQGDAVAQQIRDPFTQKTADVLRILPNALDTIDGCDGFFTAKAQKPL